MRFGSFVTEPTSWPLDTASSSVSNAANKSTLYHVALQWLTEDRNHRRELEKQGRKVRGARREEVSAVGYRCFIAENFNKNQQAVPSDSEKFYRQ